MKFDCQFTVLNILPAYRSIIASELLNKHGFTQLQAADKMGMTQAAISNYQHSKRAKKCREVLGDDFLVIQSLACESAEKIANNNSSLDEVMKDLCNLCMKLRE
jgi:hypothetical protein